MRKSFLAAAKIAAVICVAAVSSKVSAALVYTTGFEPSGSTTYPADNYAVNQVLNGQQGWTGSVAGASYPIAAVYNYQTTFGSNSNPSNVQFVGMVDSTISPGAVGYYAQPENLTPTGPNSVVDIVFQLATPPASGSPFFGVVARSGSTPIAALGVNGGTGNLEFLAGAVPTGNPTFNGSANPGQQFFFNYEIQLNYATQTYSLYGAPLTSTQFTSANLVATGAFSASTFTDAPLTSFAIDSLTASGDGFFDNYSVSVVPEPASIMLLLGGASATLLSRRRSASSR